MFHAISEWLARHRRQILNSGLTRDNQAATARGWTAEQVRPRTWAYRDPRFATRQPEGIVIANDDTWQEMLRGGRRS